jgi:hypothetical protein
MKILLRTFAVVAGLALALPMLAQRSISPAGIPPSITSRPNYPAASILTPNNMRYGGGPSGAQRFGSFGPPRMYNPQREYNEQHERQGEHRRHPFGNGFYSYPFYPFYPAYYYDPFLFGYDNSYVQGDSSVPAGGTFNNESQPPANDEVAYPQYRPYVEPNAVIDDQGHVYVRQSESNMSAAQPSAREQQQPPESSSTSTEQEPRTVLIFKDGRQLEVSNYAIMGSTLYLFAGDHRKIPLDNLDLAATEKANSDRGIEFRVPNAS